MSHRTCPRCDGMMETGFLLDAHGRSVQQCLWAEGEMWVHMLEGKRRLPVSTYRCTDCGYLESFAHDSTTKRSDHNQPSKQLKAGDLSVPASDTYNEPTVA